jgi:hypothetical protein
MVKITDVSEVENREIIEENQWNKKLGFKKIAKLQARITKGEKIKDTNYHVMREEASLQIKV